MSPYSIFQFAYARAIQISGKTDFFLDTYTDMPKKRKRVIAVDGPDIPYSRVRVEWIDCVSDSGWATDKEFDRMKFAKPINEGWLYSKDKNSLKLFASYDKDEDGITFGDRTMIPIPWVKKVTKL